MQQHPVKALFEAISKGDEAAFSELFRRYDKRFYSFTFKMIHDLTLAEELTQEIFIKIWQNRAALPAIHNPEAYLLTTAANHVLNNIKKRLSEQKMLERLAYQMQKKSVNNTEESLLLHESEALLQLAIERLPKQQKKVYQLSRTDGMNYEEIARVLKISPNTVRNHLVEALRSIRSYFEGEGILPVLFLLPVLSFL